MLSNGGDGGNDNNAGANTSTQQTQGNNPTKQSTPPKSSGKAGQWTSQPTPDDMRSFLDDYFGHAPDSPEDAWKMGNANFQGGYPGGYGGFQEYWSKFKQAKVVDAQEKEGFYWEVVVEYTKKNGDKATERRGISFQWASPNFLLSSDKSLGSY
jgi:eukaryotic-like serine/threonine-protein kinase